MPKKEIIKEIHVDPVPLRALKDKYTTLIIKNSDFNDILLNKDLNPATGSLFYDEQKRYFMVEGTCYVNFKQIDTGDSDSGQDKTAVAQR
jgi:hypothetical protein